jgi:hypothetical protein
MGAGSIGTVAGKTAELLKEKTAIMSTLHLTAPTVNPR